MSELRLRKFSPVDRQYSVYEVVDQRDRVLFDISRTDENVYEIALHDGASGAVLVLEDVEMLIAKAKALLGSEEPV